MKQQKLKISSRKQVETLASPIRQEIVDLVQATGPCSIARMGELLGRAADSLYFHIRKLERVGLLIHAGTQSRGRRAEALYDVPGELFLDYDLKSSPSQERLGRTVAAMLRLAHRDFENACDSKDSVPNGARRNLWGARMKAWLNQRELQEVRGHLEAISRLMSRSRQSRNSRLHAVTFVLNPLSPQSRNQPSD